MADAVASAWVEILPDFSGFQAATTAGMVPALAAGGAAGGKAGAAGFGASLVAGIAKFAAPVAGAIAALGIGSLIGNAVSAAIDTVAESIDVASQLEQSIGAVDAIFKENAATVHAWAESASKDVGLSQRAYNELASVLGAQLKNMGVAIDEVAPKTNELITLGADLAAQFGGSTADAVSALSSLMRGERDPIERYGVSINEARLQSKLLEMGLSDLTGEAATAARTQATLALLYEQTADAQGTFGRESDTLAGAQSRLAATWEDTQAKLGTAFLPAMITLTDVLANDVAPEINKLIEEVGPELASALATSAPAIAMILIQLAKFLPILAPIVEDMLPGFAAAMVGVGVGASVLLPFLRTVSTMFLSIGSAATTAFTTVSGLVGQFTSIGANLVNGLIEGITTAGKRIQSAVLDPIRDAVTGVKRFLGIQSPSKLFAGIGENVALGFVGGVDSVAPQAQTRLQSMVAVPKAARVAESEAAVRDRPIYADGIGLLGWLRGETELIFIEQQTQQQQTLGAGKQVR